MFLLFANPIGPEHVLLTNGIALILLFVIFLNTQGHKNVMFDQKLYRYVIIIVTISLVAECLSFLCNELPASELTVFCNKLINAILFANNPLVGLFWVIYAYFKSTSDIAGIKKRLPLLIIPAAINAILSFLSIPFDILFKVDSNNVYDRSPFIWFTFAMVAIYLIYAYYIILKNKRNYPKNGIATMLLFPVPAVVCTLLQLCFYGYSLIWIGCAISILLVSFNVQNEASKTDYLTGLPNRLKLDLLLKSRLEKNPNKTVVGLMADIDHFKAINDNFGHTIGDQALIDVADIFLKSINSNDFVARYGGDEFIFILNGKSDAQKVIEKLQKNTEEFNKTAGRIYKLDFSLGVLEYSITTNSSSDEFYRLIDKKMYAHKMEKKKNGS